MSIAMDFESAEESLTLPAELTLEIEANFEFPNSKIKLVCGGRNVCQRPLAASACARVADAAQGWRDRL